MAYLFLFRLIQAIPAAAPLVINASAAGPVLLKGSGLRTGSGARATGSSITAAATIGAAGFSSAQDALHPSPSSVFPSSQSSSASGMVSPQRGSTHVSRHRPGNELELPMPSSHSSPSSVCPLRQTGSSVWHCWSQPSKSMTLLSSHCSIVPRPFGF